MITVTLYNENESRPLRYEEIEFPSGEIGIEFEGVATIHSFAEIYAEVVAPHDIMKLFLIIDALKKQHKGKIKLILPYIPFGRQDRYTTDTSSFSLKVFANMLNSFELNQIDTMTPHSNVSGLLINNLRVIEPTVEIVEYYEDFDAKETVIVAPDAGAEKRAYLLAHALGVEDVYVCSKRRNARTGEIIGMVAPEIPVRKHIIVVDDICDGGRTFIELAKVLPDEDNRISLDLFVTHGIFSKGRDVLFDAGYDDVYAVYTFIEERLQNDTTN